MKLKITTVGCCFLVVFLTGCLGVGDSLVVIEGRLVDQSGVPFDRCEASLRLADSKELLESLLLDRGRLEDGRFSLSFHVPGRWADCYFTFSCDNVEDEVSSTVVRRGYKNPIELGNVVLKRVKE